MTEDGLEGDWSGILLGRERPAQSLRLRRAVHAKASFQSEKPPTKKPAHGPATIAKSCGEIGIRTRDTLLAYTRFPGVPLKPLEHLSNSFSRETGMQIYE